ncbi:hypothetical protein VHEMI04702 [[Torrubiella] hemipterigena]|uniref:Uncharacterized protein n=1 Tax=[Torrubiella] hemipterigena TaxID=1531966 RepID=A0A0A1TGX3_9HYPO|nr:hypothetical protein VHEMI04702 [[Torrubiella] hemipterigena]
MSLVASLKAYIYTQPAAVPKTDKLVYSLTAALSVVVTVAQLTWADLPDYDEAESNKTTIKRQFYQNFIVQAVTLLGALKTFDLESVSGPNPQLDNALLKVHDSLENTCASWTNADGVKACDAVGVKRRATDLYPKVYALGRLQPDEGEVSDKIARYVARLIHICSSNAEKRSKILSSIDVAFNALQKTSSFDDNAVHHCPLRFTDYPFKHVRQLSATLFGAIEKCWRCPCNTPLHLSRAMKLNLTHYQHFETAPRYGHTISPKTVLFRIMFPTSLAIPHWQATDVAVRDIDYIIEAPQLVGNKFCHIIEQGSANIVPNMAVYEEKLWQLQSEFDESWLMKVPDRDFKTLAQLLDETSSPRTSSIRHIAIEDRIALAFILVTSFIHLFNVHHHGLYANLTAQNVCFYINQQSLNIMKPYLNLNFQQSRPPVRNLNAAHWFPDILSLGILLLELFRGSALSFPVGQDKCTVALGAYDKWKARQNGKVPDGCFQAVIACIQPKQLREGGLGKANIKDNETRKYIFERILYPLGDVLSTICKVPLHKLPEHTMRVADAAPDVSNEELSNETLQASAAWRKHLKSSVFDAVYHSRFQKLPDEVQKSNRVKVAVLDTGLQLPEHLQAAYIDDGAIASTHCKSFCGAEMDWNVDSDGHGTRVAGILLDVAPKVELYIAKVCQRQSDFVSGSNAANTQRNIAEAIRYAATVWGVDIIVMSFGFEQRIRCIHEAIYTAQQTANRPLFFAATQNDGAHSAMAWPAREMFVFGISATDGNGAASAFNPEENNAPAILYALGEGIKTYCVPNRDKKGPATKVVSGTSYAAPVAAAFAASLLLCVRLGVANLSDEEMEEYEDLPERVQRMDGMLKVMQHCMSKRHHSLQMSLLPWDLLNAEGVENGTIISTVRDLLDKS